MRHPHILMSQVKLGWLKRNRQVADSKILQRCTASHKVDPTNDNYGCEGVLAWYVAMTQPITVHGCKGSTALNQSILISPRR
jgi:hypothetical protein